MCLALLEEKYVATVHGAAYHMSPYLRISTATADDALVEGCGASPRSARSCADPHDATRPADDDRDDRNG